MAVVRHAAKGCNVELEVLSNCIARKAKGYSYQAYSATERKVARDAQDLFTQLPIGAARLSGKVRSGNMLRTDYMLVGVEAVPPESEWTDIDLEGTDCARATHVVAKIYVGGFAMAAGSSEAISGGATLFGAGIGASSSSEREILAEEGQAAACDLAQRSGQPAEQCAVPLRIGLAPVRKTGQQTAGAQVRIPGGNFLLGVPDLPGLSEYDPYASLLAQGLPQRQVRVAVFAIDRTEVTVSAYRQCEEARVCSPPAQGRDCNWGVSGRGNHPVNCVTWLQADQYCKGLRQRLPTEEEWEYAARGTDGRLWTWCQNCQIVSTQPVAVVVPKRDCEMGSRDPCERGWPDLCDGMGPRADDETTCPVGSKTGDLSPFGVADLAANVSEWTSSRPRVRGVGDVAVIRGGRAKAAGALLASLGFRPVGETGDSEGEFSTIRRDVQATTFRDPGVGFRCAQTSPEPGYGQPSPAPTSYAPREETIPPPPEGI